MWCLQQKAMKGSGEMTQLVKVLVTKPDDLIFILGTSKMEGEN